MPTHKKTFRASSGPFAIEKAKSASPTIEVSLEETIADGSTDLQVSVFIESTGLLSFHLWSDQAVTVKTNSSGAPQETFTLNGADAESWITGEAGSPIAGDVTSLFVTNASGNDATLKLLAGWS